MLIPLLSHPEARVRQGVAVLLRRTEQRLWEQMRERDRPWEADALTPFTLERLRAVHPILDRELAGVDPVAALGALEAMATELAPEMNRRR